jgi:rod shape-determining protein MreD
VPVTTQFVARVRIALLLLVTILFQTTLAADLRVGGVAPDLMVLLAICAGLAGGTEAGAWVGFWAGLLADLFLVSTPLGLSALTYCLVGAGVGALRDRILPDSRLLLPLAAVAGTAAAVVLWVVLGDVLGQDQLVATGRSWLIRVAVIEAGWAAVFAWPVGWLYGWAARGSTGAERMASSAAGPDRLPLR